MLALVLNTILIYVAVIAVVRLNGLRSFSKMSSFDFAVSVAIGSIMASVALSSTVTIVDGLVALAVIFLLQRVVSYARVHHQGDRWVDNRPRLLMVRDRFVEEALANERVTKDDVRAKLREANVTDYDQVMAVVLENTGDISVLHGEPGQSLESELLDNVIGAEHYFEKA